MPHLVNAGAFQATTTASTICACHYTLRASSATSIPICDPRYLDTIHTQCHRTLNG
ncbi:hypothetical protein PLICRDRAFT_42115 [Plicaturopsis crispa FD-325 SS-3]|nr:hypothetical protein PLICRDRAFT_42115 [Plicaturopsis crispa FD-325 SS-3]